MLILDNGSAGHSLQDSGTGAGTWMVDSPRNIKLYSYLFRSIATNILGKSPPSFAGNPPYDWNEYINIYNSDDDERNSSLWCGNDGGIAAIPWQSATNGILVTKRDLIFANHYGASASVVFMAPDNSTSSHSIDFSSGHEPRQIGSTDIMVATLTTDVPSSIVPAKLLPADFRDYISERMPCMFTNQDGVVLTDAATIPGSGEMTLGITVFPKCYYPRRGFDSGSAIFVRIFGQLAALGTFHGSDTAPILSDHVDAINEALSDMGSTETVSTVDLSPFA